MLDKTPLKSKKFIAYLIADLGWKFIILYSLMHLKSKIEAGEFNFIDHPYFSVLVKVEEIAN